MVVLKMMSFTEKLNALADRMKESNVTVVGENVPRVPLTDFLSQLEEFILRNLERYFANYNKLYVNIGSTTLRQLMTHYRTDHNIETRAMPLEDAIPEFQEFLNKITQTGQFKVHLVDFWYLGAGLVVEWENQHRLGLEDERFVKFPLKDVVLDV